MALVPSDAPGLRQPAARIKLFGPMLAPLINQLNSEVARYSGLGLAAPQVGTNLQAAVVRLPAEGFEFVMLNPRITAHSERMDYELEGCLSLPGRTYRVGRWRWVTVAFDNQDGERRVIIRATGLLARVLQHEISHLEGRLIDGKPEAQTP